MRLFVRKLTSRRRRKVGLPDERSSPRRAQSLQLDRVSGQACAHLGQSCSIRATNHARRWPPGPKFRQARLPPLLHDVLALSHPVRGCEPHQQRLHLACHGRQAAHQWRAYLASFSLPTVQTTHASYGADTLAASFQHRLVLVWPLLLCVYPLCSCHSAAASSAQKEVKLVKCDRKVEIFSGAARQGRRTLRASAPSEKKGTFQ